MVNQKRVREVIRYILRKYFRWFIITILCFIIGYFITEICKTIKEHHIILTVEGIKTTVNHVDYPETNNPIMYGVTIKEYNAIRRK